ncbi:MAG: AraC family transcriptional regulator [Ruminococcus flavefaciens]|nr:AraC family transcriptional regulator [Ruminococcus flavefaciens]
MKILRQKSKELLLDQADSHPKEKIRLEQLALKSGYSTARLCRKFKEETGMLLTEYIQSSKVKHALHLLVSTQRSIEDISHDLAFSSRSYFTSCS